MSLPTRTLGKDGPKVTGLGAGLMSLGHAYGHAGDDETRLAYLDRLYELGEHFWDNADIYGDSEEVVGKWFAANPEKRKDIFLATKFGFADTSVFPFKLRSDPEYVKEACEASLKKLQTTYIDLYYCHRVDGVTPIEKTVEAMVKLKNEGKVRHLGLSEISVRQLRRAYAIHPIAACQMEYSPFALEIESSQTNFLATCKELGVSVVAYSPLGRGWLGGQIKSRDDIKGDFREHLPKYSEENFPKNLELVRKLEALARQKGCTASQLTLAWVMRQWDGLIPIPGTRRIKMAEENLGALKIHLTDEEDAEIRKLGQEANATGSRLADSFLFMNFGETPELDA